LWILYNRTVQLEKIEENLENYTFERDEKNFERMISGFVLENKITKILKILNNNSESKLRFAR